MSLRRPAIAVVAVLAALSVTGGCPAPARANIVDTACTGVGWVWTLAGKICQGGSKLGKLTGKLVGLGGKAKKVLPSGKAAAALAAGAGGASVFASLTGWVGTAAVWLLHKTGSVLSDATEPNLQSGFFRAQYAHMVLLATLLALPMLFLGVIEAVLRRDGGMLAGSVRAVPVAFILTALAAVLVAIGLSATDSMSHSIGAGASGPAKSFFDRAGLELAALGASMGIAAHFTSGHVIAHALAAPGFIVFLGAVFAVLAAGAVFLELLLREAAVYVCVLFVPLVLVARIWPRLENWAKRLAEGLVAIILSKFVIVGVLALAAGGLGSGHVSALLVAVPLLLLAAFAPIALFGLVAFAEHSWHSRGGSAGTLVRAHSTASAAERMRQTFMAHNREHQIAGVARDGGSQAGEQGRPPRSAQDAATAVQGAAGETGATSNTSAPVGAAQAGLGASAGLGAGASSQGPGSAGQAGAAAGSARARDSGWVGAGGVRPPAPGQERVPGTGGQSARGAPPSGAPEDIGWVDPGDRPRPGSGLSGGEV